VFFPGQGRVYRARGPEARTVVCNGEVIVRDRTVTGLADEYDDLPSVARETGQRPRDRVIEVDRPSCEFQVPVDIPEDVVRSIDELL